ncbi:hypothetical protein OG741_03590 [Streptomyces sp. NBC_01410]
MDLRVGNPEVGGEVVEGACGEHRQGQAAFSGQDCCRVDCAVATGDAERATAGADVLGCLAEHEL